MDHAARAPFVMFGGDYNPEQWPREVWREDLELMRIAQVNRVSIGVFSWGLLEVSDGVFEWAWLDEVMDALADAGIGANLATPTASPTSWLFHAHPEIGTVDANGVVSGSGRRLGWSPTSSVFRRYALRIVTEIATRYGTHPALKMWHVSNELGNENGQCFSEETGAEWHAWLKRRYGNVAAINAAWGTAFWGHHYRDISHISVPRSQATGQNPSLLLDFDRFYSDALRDHYRAERAILAEITPHIPATTNFMVQHYPGAVDYSQWAPDVDIVANDHYTMGSRPDRHAELAFSADRVRGMARGRPWLLMEHATGAVNWQGVNRAKAPGELARDSLTHVAHGADSVMFFQWRQSIAGSEQFHSAMLPHAGADSAIFRDVVALGAAISAVAEVAGTVVEPPRIALVFDHESAAAWRNARVPTDQLDVIDVPLAMYRPLLDHGYAVDVISWGADLSPYDVLVVPTQYMVPDADAEAVARFVEAGGHLLVSFFSGIADSNNAVRAGGYPGAFRGVLGVSTDEFFPLFPQETLGVEPAGRASLWTERVRVIDAEVVATLTAGDLAGSPAVTRVARGAGAAWYMACRLDDQSVGDLVLRVVREAGVEAVARADAGVALTRRVGGGKSFLFAINHTSEDRAVEAVGLELFTGRSVVNSLVVPPGEVRVVRESN